MVGPSCGSPLSRSRARTSGAAMLIALLSAGASAYLANKANGLAEQQAVVAERQQLISLVANIAQVPATVA